MSTANDVQEIYIGLLGRAADKPGLDYWVAEIEDGILTIEDVRANIVNEQPEYLNGIGMMTRSQGVTQLYNNLFGRDPEPEGLEYWVNGEGSSVNFDQLVLALINGASPADRLVLDNRDEVAIAYTDSDYGSADPFDIDSASSIIQGVDGTRESVDEALDAIDSGSISTGETFTLTSGTDALVGTSGNDTFIGVVDGTTWNVGDSVDGAGGDDTLKIFTEGVDDLFYGGRTISNMENAWVQDATGDLDYIDVDDNPFATLTVDGLSESTDIENVEADTAVTISNADEGSHDVNFNAGGPTAVHAAVLDSEDSTVNFNHIVLAAPVLDINYTGENLDDVDVNHYADLIGNVDDDEQNAGITDLNTTVNIDGAEDGYHYFETWNNSVGIERTATVNLANLDDHWVGLYDYHAGNSNNTIDVDISDSVDAYFEFYTYDDENGVLSSGDMDTANITLDNVGIEEDDGDDDASYMEFTDVEFVNIAVNGGGARLDYIDAYQAQNGLDMAHQEINIEANADFEVENFDATDGGTVAFTYTGAGDVTLETNANNEGETHDASALTGGLTLVAGDDEEVSVLGGSGDDDITVRTVETTVDTGDGDDKVDTNGIDFGDPDAGELDGGDGMDTIAIDDGANLAGATPNIANFEILDVTGGTGTYDLELEPGLMNVVANGGLAGPVSIINAAPDTSLSLNVFTNGLGTEITMELEDDETLDDVLQVNLAAVDKDTDEDIEPGTETDATVIADGYEGVSVLSVAQTNSEDEDEDGDKLEPEDYTNSIDLDASDMAELTLTGIAQADVTFTEADALTFVDASGNTAGVMVDVAGAGVGPASGVTFKGSSGDDMYTSSDNGDTVQGNAGEDGITLGAGEDNVRYAAVSDSILAILDITEPPDGDVDILKGFDIITGFTAGGEDIIELSSDLGLATGDARADILQKGEITDVVGLNDAEDMEAWIGDGVDFFDSGLVDRAVAFATDANGDGWVFVDGNTDGDYASGEDMVVNLAGVTTLAVTDISFG